MVAGERHDQGESREKSRDDGPDHVPARDPSGDRKLRDGRGQPEPEDQHVDRDPKELRSALAIDDADRRDEIEGEKCARKQHRSGRQAPEAEAAGEERDRHQHGEDDVRRRRLEADRREQYHADRHGSVVGKDRERQRSEQHEREPGDDQQARRMTVEEVGERRSEDADPDGSGDQSHGLGNGEPRPADGYRFDHQLEARSRGLTGPLECCSP